MAFDENEIHGVNMDRMGVDPIGPDMGRFSNVNTADMKNHFGAATAPGYTPVQQMSQNMQQAMAPVMDASPEIKINPQDPNDLWAGTGAQPATAKQQDVWMAKVDNVSYNMQSMELSGAQMGDGVSYLGGQVGQVVNELFSAITPNQPAVVDPQQQMQMQMAMQMRPGGGMFS